MEHSTKLQTPCRPAHSRNSIRSAPSLVLCCSDNRRQVSFQQHPPQELVKMERPCPAQPRATANQNLVEKKMAYIASVHESRGRLLYLHSIKRSFSCLLQFRLSIKLLVSVSSGRFSHLWSLVFIRGRNTVAVLHMPTLKFWELWESSLCSQQGQRPLQWSSLLSMAIFQMGLGNKPHKTGHFSDQHYGIRVKFSHTDEGELEPNLELELPCEQFTVRCFWPGCPSSPLSPSVPFVPTHKPMSFKRPQMTLGNVVVGVGGEFKIRQFHLFSFSILWLQEDLISHFKNDFLFVCLVSGMYRATLRSPYL